MNRTSILAILVVAKPGSGTPVRAPLGLPPVPAPANAPMAAETTVLGHTLFEDMRPSANGSFSGANCHQDKREFADGRAVTEGVRGQHGMPNTPGLLNAAYSTSLFWDGRRPTHEEQAGDPLLNPVEHGLRNEDQLLQIVRTPPGYPDAFRNADVAPEAITMDHVRRALAAFERMRRSCESPFDRYEYGLVYIRPSSWIRTPAHQHGDILTNTHLIMPSADTNQSWLTNATLPPGRRC